jgi:membrane protein
MSSSRPAAPNPAPNPPPNPASNLAPTPAPIPPKPVSAGLWQRFMHWLPVRAWQRYNAVNGGTLAGGSAYFAFFALFPAIGVGATVTGLVLQDRLDLQQRLAQSVNNALSTKLIKIGSGEGLIDLQSLTGGRVLITTALVAAIGLVFAGLGWLGAVRAGISTVFGQRPSKMNPVLAVLRDLLLLATLGAAVLATVIAGVAVTAVSQRTADWLGLSGSGATAVLQVVAVLVLAVIDIGLLLLFIRLLSGVRLPIRDLRGGAVAGGVAIGVLRLSGGLLLARATSNHALAAVSTVVIGLLVWFNLLARVSLLAASIAATVATDRGHLAPLPEPASLQVAGPGALAGVWAVAEPSGAGGPASSAGRAVARSAGRAGAGRQAGRAGRPGPGRPGRPGPVILPPPPASFGTRSQDRVAIAAGAVLGAGTLVAGRVMARGSRAALHLLTRHRADS